MPWTRRDLDAAADRYESWLHERGLEQERAARRARSVRRFIAWLDEPPEARPSRREGSATLATDVAGVPPVLVAAVESWISAGRPPQPPIAWRRESFLEAFPDHRAFLTALPRQLDRESVRAALAGAGDDPDRAVEGFIAAMAWGFGRVGYGAYRVGLMLATPNARETLHQTVRVLQQSGALPAYDALGRAKLRMLGPAFGTKFLFFAQASGARPRALIHDEAVSTWLARHTSVGVATTAWITPKYERYVALLHDWANQLGIEPEAVERCIFRSMAAERGNQWSK